MHYQELIYPNGDGRPGYAKLTKFNIQVANVFLIDMSSKYKTKM